MYRKASKISTSRTSIVLVEPGKSAIPLSVFASSTCRGTERLTRLYCISALQDYTSEASGVAEVYCYSQDPMFDPSGKHSYCDVKSCKDGWIKYKNSYCVSSDYRTINHCPEGYKYAPVGCVCISSGKEEVPCPP